MNGVGIWGDACSGVGGRLHLLRFSDLLRSVSKNAERKNNNQANCARDEYMYGNQDKRLPFFLHIVAGKLFNDCNCVLPDSVILNHAVKLSGQHCLDEVDAIRHDDSISVNCGGRGVDGVDFFYRKKLNGMRLVENVFFGWRREVQTFAAACSELKCHCYGQKKADA